MISLLCECDYTLPLIDYRQVLLSSVDFFFALRNQPI